MYSLPHESLRANGIIIIIIINCTWNTRNMQHVCNPQCLLCSLNVPLKLTKQWISSENKPLLSFWTRVDTETFTTGGKLSKAALIILIMMMPMMLGAQLWYQSSASSPVCSLLQWRQPRTGQSQRLRSAMLRTGQSEREDASRFCVRWCYRRHELQVRLRWACLFIYWELCFEKNIK